MAAATTAAISPVSGSVGDTVTLTGAGIVSGAAVEFRGANRTRSVPGVFVSAGEITAAVPVFDGLAEVLAVSVVNPGEVPSNEQSFALGAWPPVETRRPLCSLAQVKERMQIPVGDHGIDDLLLQLIDIASAQIETAAKRSFTQVLTLTGELHNGNGSSILQPNHTPIVSVSALSIDGIAISAADYTVQPEYVELKQLEEYSARLRGVQQLFGVGSRNVSISYTAGYDAVPQLVADACVMQVQYLRNVGGHIGIRSESSNAADHSTSYHHTGLATQVQIIANRYQRPRMRPV